MNDFTAPQGWQCPICKRVYSPFTPTCFYCGGSRETTTNTGTLDIGGVTITYPLKGSEE